MRNSLEIRYWKTNRGTSPVLDFIAEVKPEGARAKIQKQVKYFAEQGTSLITNNKILEKVQTGLFELKVNWGKMAYRILVFIQNSVAWLLHAFRKTTNKLRGEDINLALKRKEMVLNYAN